MSAATTVKSAPKPGNPGPGRAARTPSDHPTSGRPAGRPALIEDENTISALAAAYGRGLKPHAAARSVGLNPRTVERWKIRAQAGEEPYAAQWARVERASANLCAELLDLVVEDARGRKDPATGLRAAPNIQSAKWVLERRYGFSAAAPIPHTPEPPPPPEEPLDEPRPEDLDARTAELAARVGRLRPVPPPDPTPPAPGRKL